MVIESLGLYYHVQCFRCCVCHSTLGNGSRGADVRVRVNKLHCRNCYSNDEGIFTVFFCICKNCIEMREKNNTICVQVI
jgi:hypothetical protein